MSIEMHDLESIGDDDKEEIATLEQFERCMDACGFGIYQWWMLSISFVGVLAHVSVMASTPYPFVLGDATQYNEDVKIIFFLIPYLGIIFSSIISGFLSDSFGRKRVTVVCYAGLAVATLHECMSRQYRNVVFAKFCEGFFLGGALVASTALQAEFQTEKSRDRIMMTLNFFVSISHILVALPGFAMLPLMRDTIKIGDLLEMDLWDICNVFNLVICLAACLLYAWIPESPKSDFVHGRYKNALKTVKRMFAMNTGKSINEFPYQLLGLTDNDLRSQGEQVRTTWAKAKLILKPPLRKFLISIMAAQIIFTFGYNTMRLWYPTVVRVIDYSPWMYSNSTAFLCTVFENKHKIEEIDILMEVRHHIVNCLIIIMFGVIPYIVITIFINIGKKLILLISLCVGFCCIISMHWIKEFAINIVAFCIFMAFGQIINGLIQAIVVELFPVWTKSLALSLSLTASAIGAVLAEVLFSSLEQLDCTLASIVAATMACAAFFTLYLPK